MAFRSFDQWHRDAFWPRPKKWHQNFETQDLHTRKKFKLDFFGSLAIRAPPAPCLTRLSIEAFIADEPRNLVHIVRRRRKAASERMIKQKGRLLEV